MGTARRGLHARCEVARSAARRKKRIGNAEIDLAFALLTLQVGGVATPPVKKAPALAAFVTGIVAVEAPAPLPSWTPEGSTLREDQLADLRVALPWTAELLGLPPPS
jgi:hypothetical protein